MTADIIDLGIDNEGIKVCEACEEAAQLIEAEMVRWSQQYAESEYMSLTSVGADALEQMAAWAMARLAEQSPSKAVEFSMRIIYDIKKEHDL